MSIPSWCRVGAKVVCVKAFSPHPETTPQLGETYTIRGVDLSPGGEDSTWIWLAEIHNPPHPTEHIEASFNLKRFRPLVEQTNDGEVERDMEAHFNKFLRTDQKEVA